MYIMFVDIHVYLKNIWSVLFRSGKCNLYAYLQLKCYIHLLSILIKFQYNDIYEDTAHVDPAHYQNKA